MSDSYLVPSNWLGYKFSSKSNEILLVVQFCPNLGFEYKIVSCPSSDLYSRLFL